VHRYLLHTFATTQSALMKQRVARFLVRGDCPVCQGRRLKPEAMAVTFAGLDIAQLQQLPLDAVHAALLPAAQGRFGGSDTSTTDRTTARRSTATRVAAGGSAHAAAPDVRRTGNLSEEKRIAAQRIAESVCGRIATLQGLGLGYLQLDRSTPTLSPGEMQRLRLATQIRSNLCWTSRLPACTQLTAKRCWQRWMRSSAPATRCSWWSTTSPPCAAPTGWWTSARGLASEAA
jgi:excinuclease ABC subunit A